MFQRTVRAVQAVQNVQGVQIVVGVESGKHLCGAISDVAEKPSQSPSTGLRTNGQKLKSLKISRSA